MAKGQIVDNERDVLVELNLGVQVEAAVPMPFVLANESEVHIVFYGWDTRGERWEECVAVAHFEGTQIVRFGGPNDDALEGHPLARKGLHAYRIYEVLNSSIVEQLRSENKVRFPNADYSRPSHHFMITFHDSMFEGVGVLTVTVSDKPYKETVREVMEKMLEWP